MTLTTDPLERAIANARQTTYYYDRRMELFGYGDGRSPVIDVNTARVWVRPPGGRPHPAVLTNTCGIPAFAPGIPDGAHLVTAKYGKITYVLEIANEALPSLGGLRPIDQLLAKATTPKIQALDVARIAPTSPTASMMVEHRGSFAYHNPATGLASSLDAESINLTSLQAALTSGEHRLAVIALNTTETVEEDKLVAFASAASTSSDTLPNRDQFQLGDIQNVGIAHQHIPLAAVYLYYGQTAVEEADFYRAYDPRPLFDPIRKDNMVAAALPTTADDSAAGYGVGSFWLYGGVLYVCVDATASAALWRSTSLRRRAVRTHTAAGDVTVTTADEVVIVKKTSGAATVVNLPASPVLGDSYVIKDGKFDAASNNITLTPASGNIEGASTYVLNQNGQTARLLYDGTQWLLI